MTPRILFVYLIRCLNWLWSLQDHQGLLASQSHFPRFPKAMAFWVFLINPFTPATDSSDLWKDGQLQSQPEELSPSWRGCSPGFYAKP